MSDLIRREDALKAVDVWESDWIAIDSAIRALPAVQPVAVPLCECGMTGPCKWTECKAPILSAHVNKTPKSEHEAANVLTPAKGDTHD